VRRTNHRERIDTMLSPGVKSFTSSPTFFDCADELVALIYFAQRYHPRGG
jgi:hypothetical protein